MKSFEAIQTLHDAAGNTVKTIDALGNETTSTYDAAEPVARSESEEEGIQPGSVKTLGLVIRSAT